MSLRRDRGCGVKGRRFTPRGKGMNYGHLESLCVTPQVVYRSASAHFFIFIQISSEMWEFDSSGECSSKFPILLHVRLCVLSWDSV